MNSSAEDALRALLHQEATTVIPAGDGLEKIRQRVARKRRLRTMLVPSTALVLGGAAAAVVLLGGTPQSNSLIQNPASQGPPSAQPTTSPAPAPTATTTVVLDPNTGLPPTIWPFTSGAQAASWKTSAPWANDQLETARRFLKDYLAVTGVTLHQTCVSCEEIGLRLPGTSTEATLRLIHYTVGQDHVFSVDSVSFPDLKVISPKTGAAISSPTTVTGRLAQAVDENVLIRLVDARGKQLATTGAPAGSAVPWSGSMAWSDTTWSRAAIVLTTYSAKDGALSRLAVLPVRRGATAAPTFVGLSQGHVSSFDAVTGTLVKQLTYPAAGFADIGVAWNGSSLLWVRSRQTGCSDALNRSDSGKTTTVVAAGSAHLGTPALSPDGTVVAYLSTPCNGGAATVVVQAAGSPARSIATTPGATQVADVRNDGSVLINTRGAGDIRTLTVVTPVQTSVAAGTRLATTCTTIGGAFDGDTPIGWESCADGVRVARFSASGARTGAGPLLGTKAYAEDVTVRDSVVLAWLYDGSQLGRIVRVSGSGLTVLVGNNGCTATPEPKGCVRAPAW